MRQFEGPLAISEQPSKAATRSIFKDTEVLELVERKKLWGRGIGWIDMHLLASALVTGCTFWTLDYALKQAAIENGVAGTTHESLE